MNRVIQAIQAGYVIIAPNYYGPNSWEFYGPDADGLKPSFRVWRRTIEAMEAAGQVVVDYKNGVPCGLSLPGLTAE